ncbi:MAG: hypothetical protein HQK53_00615 [Oligoflexia bacterium]|nr:hypothetical protein [Oligoflexia bacterium]
MSSLYQACEKLGLHHSGIDADPVAATAELDSKFLEKIAEKHGNTSAAYRIISTHMSGYMLCGKKVYTGIGAAAVLGAGITYYGRTCITPFGKAYSILAPSLDLKYIGIGVSLYRDNMEESPIYNHLQKIPIIGIKGRIFSELIAAAGVGRLGRGNCSTPSRVEGHGGCENAWGLGAEAFMGVQAGVITMIPKLACQHKTQKILNSIAKLISDPGYADLMGRTAPTF